MNISRNAKLALLYHAAGWHPIPVVGKEPAWKNTTGANGYYISKTSLAKIKNQNASGNIGLGLRMGDDVIGIDVDAYKDGGRGLHQALADIGNLPPTYRSTARWGNNPSGARFYRIPVDLDLSGVGRKLEKYNIDVIRKGHRHANVSPTIHPDLYDMEYRWYGLNDEELSSSEYCFEVPNVSDLPELPMSWCMYLDPTYDPYNYLDSEPGDNNILSPYVNPVHVTTSTSHVSTSPVVPSSSSPNPATSIIYSIPLCKPCTNDYYTHNIYRTIHDEAHTTTARNTSLYQLARDGYWCVLRGELTEQNLDDALLTNFTCNGYVRDHGIDDFNRVVAHQKKYAAERFVNLPRNYNDARMQDLADRVSAMKFSAKSREALYTAILDAKSKNKSYAIIPTRGMGEAVGVSSMSISKYVHQWEQAGIGIIKKGRTTEFRFYLDDTVLEMPTEPKVDLTKYQRQVDIFNKYIQDARAATYRKNGQTPPKEENNETLHDDLHGHGEVGMHDAPSEGHADDPGTRPTPVDDPEPGIHPSGNESPVSVRTEDPDSPVAPGRIMTWRTQHNMNISKNNVCPEHCPLC